MSIKPLPEDTIRSLGSQVTINSSSALVKELVDNAIDAKATSIAISISKNTVDKIEIRDNGHGIRTDDFAYIALHGHTSKLRTFEDLHRLGGTTLGFRGEALAAANDLGKVVIATRTAQEKVGSVLHLQPRSGGVEKLEHKGLNIGTTITVTEFMSAFLPRRAQAIKDASKEIAKVKDLLIAHAFARPHIQFRFNVLQTQISFSYEAQPGWDAKGAAYFIFRDLSFQCLSKTISKDITTATLNTADYGRGSATPSIGHFEIQACLPKPDADPAKIYNKGTFISIDSRPLSATQGTTKKLVTIFRRYLCASVPASTARASKPFLQMNIECPPATYDPNVESAKDDVLFADETLILELFESLCREVYGLPDRQIQPSRATLPPELSPLEKQLLGMADTDEELEEPRQPSNDSGSHNPSNQAQHRRRSGRLPRRNLMSEADAARGFTVNMDASAEMSDSEEGDSDSNELSDDEEHGLGRQTHDEHEATQRGPALDINPWTIARMATQRETAREPDLRDFLPPQASRRPPASVMSDDTLGQDPPVLYQYGTSPRGIGMSPRGSASSPRGQGRGRGRPQLKVPGGAYRDPRTAAAQFTSSLLDQPEQRNASNKEIFAQLNTPPSSSPRGSASRGGRGGRGRRGGRAQQERQQLSEVNLEDFRHDNFRQTQLQLRGGRPRIIHSGMMGSDDDEPDALRVSLRPRGEVASSSPRGNILREEDGGDEHRGRTLPSFRHPGLEFSPAASYFPARQAQLDLTPLGAQIAVRNPGVDLPPRRRSMSPDRHRQTHRSVSPEFTKRPGTSMSRARSKIRRRSKSRHRSMSRMSTMSDSNMILRRSPPESQTQGLTQWIHADAGGLADSIWIMLPFDAYLQDGSLGQELDALDIEEIQEIEHVLKRLLLAKCVPEIKDEVKVAVEEINLVGMMKGKAKTLEMGNGVAD